MRGLRHWLATPAAALLGLGGTACELLSPTPEPVGVAFVTNVAGARGGVPFTTQPVVEIRDAKGRRAKKATQVVTLVLSANPAGGTLSGTLAVSAVDGMVTFAGLALDKIGSYTLTASAEGLTSATSASFDVTAGPPSRMTFVTQPAGASGGTPFASQPAVELFDPGGNRAAGTPVSVTIALANNPGPGTLLGTRTATTTSGLASFTDLKIDRAATGYTLAASAPSLDGITSAPFDVVVGPAAADSSLVSIERSRVVPGDTVTATLRARDAGGNVLTVGGSAVAFSSSGGTSAGAFGATTDHGNGTYSARFLAQSGGTPATIRATVAGTPVTGVLPLLKVVQFSAVTVGATVSPAFSCGLDLEGAAYCWGGGGFGNLGGGVFGNSIEPLQVVGGHTWSKISAGSVHACGLTTQGTGYCWGSGSGGALGNGISGNGSFDNRNAPVPITTTLAWLDIGSAFTGTCAIGQAGAGYCWGSNAWGRLGDGTNTPSNLPRTITAGLSWGSVGLAIGNGCGITTGGSAYCWGISGLLAPGGTQDCGGTACSLSPLPVPGGRTFRPGSIAVNGNHVCAIGTDDSAWCWGYNSNGELGNGTNNGTATPAQVSGGHAFAQVTAGDGHTCGVTTAGDAYCWGNNGTGHLGTGSFASTNAPQLVTGGFKFTQLSTGQSHTCGITTQGGVLCWGQNNEGQLGDGAPISSRPRPVWLRFP